MTPAARSPDDRPMPQTLVWITGASSGIGAALAASVPVADAAVVNVSRSAGDTAAEHLPADLADPVAWAAVEAHLLARVAAAPEAERAVLIHCAGTLDPIGPAGAVDSAAYARNVVLNSAAPQVIGHAFLRAVAGFDGDSHLVQLTSGAARKPYAGWTSYSAGKAAIDAWVVAAGKEQAARAERGLPWCRVVALAPGVVETPMQEAIRAMPTEDFPDVEKFRSLHQRGETRTPAEAAGGIWQAVQRGLDTGTVLDLRDLA